MITVANSNYSTNIYIIRGFTNIFITFMYVTIACNQL